MFLDLSSWSHSELLRKLAEIETELWLLASCETDSALRLTTFDGATEQNLAGVVKPDLADPTVRATDAATTLTSSRAADVMLTSAFSSPDTSSVSARPLEGDCIGQPRRSQSWA